MKIDFVTTTADIKALKKFIDDPNADMSLKVDMLDWMMQNNNKVNNPKHRDDDFHSHVYGFLRLIGAK